MGRATGTVALVKRMKTSAWRAGYLVSPFIISALVVLLAACTTKKCAELKYSERDGSTIIVEKCFDVAVDTVNANNALMSIMITPPAEQRRFEWLAEQKKEGIQSITLTDRE